MRAKYVFRPLKSSGKLIVYHLKGVLNAAIRILHVADWQTRQAYMMKCQIITCKVRNIAVPRKPMERKLELLPLGAFMRPFMQASV